MIYLDTSAALKVLLQEQKTMAVRTLFEDDTDFISSRLLAVELHAVVTRRGLRAENAGEILEKIALVRVGDDITQRAIDLRSGLRTLDALHLATAVTLGTLVTSILSFDNELSSAASRYGVPSLEL